MTERSQGAAVQPPPAVTPAHPVSAALEKELRAELKQKGLVIWLDMDQAFTSFVEGLTEQHQSGVFPYPVLGFRGSYLELMLALEKHGNDLHPDKVLIHMPGFNETTICDSPLLEIYRAGKRYRKALPTLVEEAAQGRALPEDVAAFLREPGLTLERADTWLLDLMRDTKDPLSVYLKGSSVETILRDLITPESSLTRLLSRGDTDAARQELQAQCGQVLEALRSHLGIAPDWTAFIAGDQPLTPDVLRELGMSWLMAVEFVHDLKEAPASAELVPLAKLAPVMTRECRRLADLFRAHYPDEYVEAADQFEELLAKERDGHAPRALGSIDTFRWEEQALRKAALAALGEQAWQTAESYARERTPEKCFWVKRSPDNQQSWELITLAAAAGMALQAEGRKGLAGVASLDEATDRYAARLHRVDLTHRRFEQRAHALLSPTLADFQALKAAETALRQAYREWANRLAREFNGLCASLGPLPSRDYRQRHLYEQVVQPELGTGDRVAYFLVDAMRFEMASELAEAFKAKKFQVQLRARLAELPTVTEVGMNVLAPVESEGKLHPVLGSGGFAGFRAGETTVSKPADRVKAMSTRSLTSLALDFDLASLVGEDPTKLKKRFASKPNLIVVRSGELDSAGESGFHLGTFEHTLRMVRDAVYLLALAGVERFVLTSDHGFLLQDTVTTENLDFGANKLQPKRRHAFSTEPSGRSDALDIKLSALEYTVSEDRYLAFCRSTALWKTAEKVPPFVHGGNSLQERVIPVLMLERHSRRGKVTASYEVVATALPAELGRQRLQVQVQLQRENSATLNFHGPKRISLALRVFGRPDVVTRIVSVSPPGSFDGNGLAIPPGADASTVEFELEGETDERVRVEIFHAEGVESVTPRVVDGFFQSFRNRRADPKTVGNEPKVPSTVPPPPGPGPGPGDPSWADLVADEKYRKVLAILESGTMVNEAELREYLGSARQVRLFALRYEQVTEHLPFDIEIRTVAGLKTYVRKD